MHAIKTMYNEIPEIVNIPKEFIHKKGEIIIIINEDIPNNKSNCLKDYFGIIPDFPERAGQGEYEKRAVL